MSAELVCYWLQSKRNAIICLISLKPIEHSSRKGKPLSSRKGQAEAFFLIDDKGNWWILKKFHNARNLEHKYLTRVGSLLPKHDGFTCGTQRYVLSRGSLCKTLGCFYSKDLDYWLDGSVLMPRVAGLDWSALAGKIRKGGIKPSELQRLTICKNLTSLVELLETRQCCHRDLSSGNIFIDENTWEVYLIDFDSFYHPSLRMPQFTTCGTPGYTSHLACNNDKFDPGKTWCQHVDRFALALLNAEFLLLGPQSKATEEGGIFDQDELRKQKGPGIKSVVASLKSRYPQAAQLLQAAIQSTSFSDCPAPKDWLSFYNTIPGLIVKPPSLSDFADITPEQLSEKLRKYKPALRPWPVPGVEEMTIKTKKSKTRAPTKVQPLDHGIKKQKLNPNRRT